ncbi:hypothetical protein [uncultured Proteiniphilum sp.]|uniref:hypothetical protein n=1 Tax=uncultured Proteiniphilum sp. TaxID=497637 RepID=UPI00260F773D|nr:hypothetical protein [uncultured Proteiniphilum sp.]
MSEKRKEYIDQLLSDLKLLEERLLSVKESDTLPFSFFSASFDRLEKISRSLHELELMQIGEMKRQMERLVRFLSESDGRNNAVREPAYEKKKEAVEEVPENREQAPRDKPEVAEAHADQPGILPAQPDFLDQPEYSEQSEHSNHPEYPSAETDDILPVQERVSFTERIVLPEYKDPRITGAVPPPPAGTGPDPSEKNGKEKSVMRSLNDIIQAPPALLDLKRGISLNDRFLFQRELFNNNRSEMNNVMDRLNALGNFEEAEIYLKDERDWNFEDQTVKEFLRIIKKGFE